MSIGSRIFSKIRKLIQSRNSCIVVSITIEDESTAQIIATINQMLEQSYLPKWITLYLDEKNLAQRNLKIPLRSKILGRIKVKRRNNLVASLDPYRLALRDYPDNIVVVIRAGVLYPPGFLQELLDSYNKYPYGIACNRAQMMCWDNQGKLLGTSMIPPDGYIAKRASLAIIPLESGGILFPAGVHARFEKSYGDDAELAKACQGKSWIWLKVMQEASNIPVMPVNIHFVFRPVCAGKDFETMYCEPDYMARDHKSCVEVFNQFCLTGSTDSFRTYKSPMGNVLLMAGDAQLNGATLSLITLAEHLVSYGENPFLVLPCNGMVENLLQKKEIDYTVIGDGAYQWTSLLDFSEEQEQALMEDFLPRAKEVSERIACFIEKNAIDLVHENTTGSHMAADAAVMSGVGLVWHLREFNEEDHGQRLWTQCRPYERFAGADACICVSQSIMNKYRTLISPPDNLRLIYNGIDPSAYYFPAHIPFSKNKIQIVCSGRIAIGKGQLDIIRAFALINDDYPEVKVVLVGAEHEIGYVNKIREVIDEEGLEEQIEFWGVCDNMEWIWSDTDIAVVSSRFEAFGRCAVEAMVGGCLVVGANTAGTAEIIKDNETGFLYEANNSKDLARVLRKAIDDPERSRGIARAGREDAMKRFLSEDNAKQVFELHQKVLKLNSRN